MPIRARRFIRKMRGGAQSHLIEGEDGEFYVVKFLNNPQHRRILMNEWLANASLRYLQIFVPETAIVELTSSFLAENPDVCIIQGAKREPALAGLHFGSRVAVHPDRVAIYDFLPDAVLGKIENRVDFIGPPVFDKWIGNADSHQAIFFSGQSSVLDAVARGDASANRLLRSNDRPGIRVQRSALDLSRFTAPRIVLPA